METQAAWRSGTSRSEGYHSFITTRSNQSGWVRDAMPTSRTLFVASLGLSKGRDPRDSRKGVLFVRLAWSLLTTEYIGRSTCFLVSFLARFGSKQTPPCCPRRGDRRSILPAAPQVRSPPMPLLLFRTRGGYRTLNGDLVASVRSPSGVRRRFVTTSVVSFDSSACSAYAVCGVSWFRRRSYSRRSVAFRLCFCS